MHVGGGDQGAAGPVRADDSVREDANGSVPELLPCRLT